MLTTLKIENAAVIEKAELDFGKGLNIITGETGAGKSIVIDTLNAIAGERASKQLVRDGTQAVKVCAFFEDICSTVIQILSELEIETEPDNSLLISRTISSDGRSSCRVNGQPVTVSMLKKIGSQLIAICGQHDSQRLLQKENHLGYIDSIANLESKKDEYRKAYHSMLEIKKELEKLKLSESEKQQRLDFLKYQIEELKSANIIVGEKDELDAKKKRILNRERIKSALYGAHNILSGDENTVGLTEQLYSLTEQISTLQNYGNEFERYINSIDSFRYEMEDCLSDLSNEIAYLDDDNVDIDIVEQRLDVLYRLSKKYGGDEQYMLSYLEKIINEYEAIESSSQREEELEDRLKELEQKVINIAKEISNERKKYSKTFEKNVTEQLTYLDMPSARFKVSFTQIDPQENGIDSVEFLISANSGQELKPLSKIASGGELSRIMLAIRCVLSDKESAGTVIYDEIDTGVSGKAAHKIAFKLREVSNGRQVICVTHLAQIAAGADNHFLIEKNSDKDNTYTNIKKLEPDEKVREIARIIGGDVITQTTLKSASEMIDYIHTA